MVHRSLLYTPVVFLKCSSSTAFVICHICHWLKPWLILALAVELRLVDAPSCSFTLPSVQEAMDAPGQSLLAY
jgi:hypothetical protein